MISEPSEGQTEVVRYTYDAAGRLLSMATGLTSLTEEVNPAVHSVTTYAYDDLGNLVSETDALGKATTYTYDLLGNVLTKTDRNGTVFTYTYDALGRNTAMTAQNGEQTQTASYTYDYLGNLTRVVDNGQEIVYTYDVRGNLLTETAGDVVKTYAYDANGNRTSFVLAEGLGEAAVEKQNLTYAYDTIGRLMSVTNGAEITAYTYDANHNLTAETTGTAGQTPVRSVAYTYNKANLLTGKTNTQNGTVIENYTATYFANGNKKTVQKGEQTTAYTYDGMGRLLTETEGDTATVYTYTQSGNRATKTVTTDGVTTQTITYAYDKNNRLTKEQSTQDGQTVVTGYTYDHNGNQIIKNAMVLSSEGGTRSFALSENNNSTEFFAYDLRNRLTQYKNGDTKASYTYGADGFRNAKTVNGVTTSFIYDGANIVETKQGESVTDYIRGIGLIKYTDGVTTAYYFTDDHGSTSSLYGANGTKLSDYTYDAFGNEEQVSTDTNPFRYCGEYTDQESGLVYLRARYYDPQTGRFVSEDPVKDGLNWYAYCGNNPIMFVDPWGLTYVIAWSYGPNDIEIYVNYKARHGVTISKDTSQWDQATWDDFTERNAFARAAATRKKELIAQGVPESEIDVQRIDGVEDFKATWEMWSKYGSITGMDIYTHGNEDGVLVADESCSFLEDATKLNWNSSLRNMRLNGEAIAGVIEPSATFYGCQIAQGDFPQSFANTQGVRTFAQTDFASFSSDSILWHPIFPNSKALPVYLKTYKSVFSVRGRDFRYGVIPAKQFNPN